MYDKSYSVSIIVGVEIWYPNSHASSKMWDYYHTDVLADNEEEAFTRAKELCRIDPFFKKKKIVFLVDQSVRENRNAHSR